MYHGSYFLVFFFYYYIYVRRSLQICVLKLVFGKKKIVATNARISTST